MPKYKTLVIDSMSELARLAFARDMAKDSTDMETFYDIRNWTGATERIAIVIRRLKDFRDFGGEYKGLHIYLTANEQIDREYPKGSSIGRKGEPAPEPFAIKGMLDLPGKVMPETIGRGCNCVLRIRRVNGKPTLIARPESISGSAEWIVKDHLGLCNIQNGFLPADWRQVQQLIKDTNSYIVLVYGAIGMGKTRMIATFPKPIKVLDIDRGTRSLWQNGQPPPDIDIIPFNSEKGDDYLRFLGELEATLK